MVKLTNKLNYLKLLTNSVKYEIDPSRFLNENLIVRLFI
jgi:hypothetical protein